jgi:diguanylate cyclase (GGDEF)-like protein
MFKLLFNPPEHMKKKRYLAFAVTTVTLLSVSVSALLTFVSELFSSEPNFLQGLSLAVSVPLLVVPPLAYWHHKVLFELKKSKIKIRELSRTDSLTGILNRGYFFEQAAYHLALAKRHDYPISLILLDLDHFKNINDHFGHQIGDQVLRLTASILGDIIRDTDILARYGGEEFVLLMPQSNKEQASHLCKRLRRTVAEVQARTDHTLPVITMSMGGACSAGHGYEIDHLLSKADQALYQAKNNGRDTIVFAHPTPQA